MGLFLTDHIKMHSLWLSSRQDQTPTDISVIRQVFFCFFLSFCQTNIYINAHHTQKTKQCEKEVIVRADQDLMEAPEVSSCWDKCDETRFFILVIFALISL